MTASSGRLMFQVEIQQGHRELSSGSYNMCQSCFNRHVQNFSHPSKYRFGVASVERDYNPDSCDLCEEPLISESQAEPGPILVIKETESGRVPVIDLVARKHRCGSVWCPDCFKRRTAPIIAERISAMSWRSVRMLTFTVDRKNFVSAEAAFVQLTSVKAIYNVCRALKRYGSKNIKRWLWVLEWHADGYPHWHVVAEMSESGRDAMIGQDLLHRWWPYGAVRESYIESSNHWGRITGYFEKKGYLTGGDKQSHQLTLPEWARVGGYHPRRHGAMRLHTVDSIVIAADGIIEKRERFVCENQERRSLELILKDCGTRTIVCVRSGVVFLPQIEINIPYRQFLSENDGFVFVEGRGMCRAYSWIEYEALCLQYAELIEYDLSMANSQIQPERGILYAC